MKEIIKNYTEQDRLNLKLVIGLYRSYFRIHRSTQKFLATHSLTVSQFGVLEALYHLGPMKIGDIIERVLSTSGNMTVVVKNLEANGWIRRTADPEDGRATRIQLTELGADLMKGIFPEHLKDLSANLIQMSETEKGMLVQLFKKLNGI